MALLINHAGTFARPALEFSQGRDIFIFMNEAEFDMTAIDRRALLVATAATAMIPARASAAPLMQLGGKEVHVFSDGAFAIPASIVSRDRPLAEVEAAYKAEGQTPDFRNVLNVTAIKEGEAWTLFDCGAGDKFIPGSGKLLDALDAAGIDRKAVKRLIFTHAHPDHLWGAVDSFGELAFPDAEHLLCEAELTFWQGDAAKSLPADRQMFAAGATRVLGEIKDRIKTFKPGAEVAPGILAVDTSGHTPGHCSFLVSGGGQSLMVLGDAITNAVISFRHPDWHSGGDQDAAQGVATRKKLLDQLSADKTPFIGYHLTEPGLGRAEKKDGAFRFAKG
jgi:glyoxylase-like metal-dependent hydrolase (beta-lactamase superfamily II)